MTHRKLITSILGLFLLTPFATMQAQGLGPTGTSTPSPAVDGGIYQWPEGVQSPCPEVQIKQKHDHVSLPQYQAMGWDTAITCRERQIILSCMPYIPVQFTNGYYYVDEIPFNPPDTSFWMNGQGTQMAITNDDDFAPAPVQLDFPFFFFGSMKTQFRIGDNGLVTFTTTPMTDDTYPYCPYAVNNAIPWTTAAQIPNGNTRDFDRTHDAIYGVYEDTYTGSGGQYMHGHDGIYYGVVDEFPCRKIIATWNNIPKYSDQNQRRSYQIVCYEGSNIIEVHVKTRVGKPSTSKGIIGIQNATGLPQTKSNDPDNPLYWITPGAPAAFFPTGYNPIEGDSPTLVNKAFRFTPYGDTPYADGWYRILPDQSGADSAVKLTTNPTDTNGYYIPANPSSTAPTLTRAFVNPTCVSRYYYHLRFQNANGDWYNLYDTITIGIDTLNDLTITPASQDICLGSSIAPTLEFRSIQDTEMVNWYVTRISNGQQIPLPATAITPGQIIDDGTKKTISISVNSAALPQDGLVNNKIDTLIIESSIDFVSGCQNSASTMIRIFPNFDTTITHGICQGEQFYWKDDGNTYTQSTQRPYPSVTLHSQPGCDSVVRLNLTVYDVSYTVDQIVDCSPITWLNGKTYTQSNTATATLDTIVLPNRYGCDSIVQLDFTLHPLTARLHASLDHFDYDHLDVELTDISTGGTERIWQIPGSADQTTPVAYYTIPIELDTAHIMLIETSPYGCIDTATLDIPFFKESFWMPNVFTPDNPAGNNLFGSVSTQTIQQEMLIYNRFGELVFRCDSPDCKWDGRSLKGEPCSQGTYVYIIRYTNAFEPKRTHIRKGSVTLLR